MTAAPAPQSTPIDFTVLSDQLRILPTSRSWTGVQDSIRTLAARKPDEWHQQELQDHVESVRVFAEMIREHAALIAYAFACGASLGRLEPTLSSPTATDQTEAVPLTATSIHAALQLLSSAYKFSLLTTQDVHECMRRVWTALRRYAQGADLARVGHTSSGQVVEEADPLPGDGPKKIESAESVEPYFVWLQKMLKDIANAPKLNDATLSRIQGDAWASVRGRYEDFVRDVPERSPAAAEVICRTVGLLPSTVLAFAVPETSAVAWSELVLPRASAISAPGFPIPWWAHGLAMHALGFRSSELSVMHDVFSFLTPGRPSTTSEKRSRSSAAREPDEFWSSSAHLTSKRSLSQAVFVIRRAGGSMLERWPTCPTAATLPLIMEQADNLVRLTKVDLSATLGRALWGIDDCTVALEYPLDVVDKRSMLQAASELADALDVVRRPAPPVRRISFGPVDQTIPSVFGGFYLKYRPQRFEDLILRPPS